MKSAYDLAMERLEKQSPTHKVNDQQKREIAEVDSQFKAKIAERELFLKSQIKTALESGQLSEAEQIEKQLAIDIRRLNEDCEEKKEAIRKQTP
jgi:hypothetical protein